MKIGHIATCKICCAEYKIVHKRHYTCSSQCYLKSQVIDSSDPAKCWICKLAKNQNKHFVFNLHSLGFISAHRFSYQAFNGPLITGQGIFHKCDIPACVNPNHLFQSYQIDNVHDMIKKGRSNTARGANASRTVLNSENVLAIFNASGSYAQIGLKFNTTAQNVYCIKSGNTWSHLTGMTNRHKAKTPKIMKSPPLYDPL